MPEQKQKQRMYEIHPLKENIKVHKGAGSDTTYRHLLNRIAGLVIEFTQTGKVVFINEKINFIAGFSEEEMLGRDWFDLLVPVKSSTSLESFRQQLFENGELNAFRTGIRTLKGHQKIISWSSANVYDEHGSVERLIFFGFDITEQVIAEQELRISAVAFETQVGIMVTDANSRIIRVNQAFSEQAGYDPDEIIGKTPRILKSGRHDADFYTAMWSSINRTGTWQGEIWDRRKNGEIYPKWMTINSVKDNVGNVTHYVCTQNDISERKAAENAIANLAYYDPLTQLPNRRLLLDRLRKAMAASERTRKYGAILFIDLDNFKIINDTLGHLVGDFLLQEVSQRLKTCVRTGDTVARLGGDEFVVMLEDLSQEVFESSARAEAIGEKILETLNQSYQLGIHKFLNSPSIGISLFKDQQHEPEELFKQADIAMYQVKKEGRNSLRFFDPQMQQSINARAALESELRNALENQQFQLYFQIQVDSNCRPLGAEALIRWIHPERGMVSPAEFIPLAEETGLILPIGQWVLLTACAQLYAWKQNDLTRNLILSINVSANQFHEKDFVAQLQSALLLYDINPALLKLELTESMLVENIDVIVSTMDALKAAGVRLSLDDFGTGYSSLQYLKRLPLNQLKIDQSFVREIVTEGSDRAIVNTIIAMAHNLNLNVIAEGVETEEQRQILESAGCKHYQGYLFGKPLPIEKFEMLLRER